MAARRGGGGVHTGADWLAEEAPVALSFNGISHAVMMATPADLEDLALGFAITEGLLASPAQLYGVEVHAAAEGFTVELDIASASFERLKQRRRTMAGRTGCGLCGAQALGQVRLPLPRVGGAPGIAPQAIARGIEEMRQRQVLQRATGATHAAAWCRADGTLGHMREDVGRHNALDKVIGAALRAAQDLGGGFLCVTSRASFEMAQKTVLAGVGTLAAMSAPTTMALDLAREAGLCLVGFARGDDLVAYSHAGRVFGNALQERFS
ncbi:MAG: formate dehydrogenase accessory sulfurtransferase FdhD [Desulfovibrionaceae bacterium]|nr:formate dehydrogenase accessory sulfurtransferase FdhD [Desulfovibrionaceae bacterium]